MNQLIHKNKRLMEMKHMPMFTLLKETKMMYMNTIRKRTRLSWSCLYSSLSAYGYFLIMLRDHAVVSLRVSCFSCSPVSPCCTQPTNLLLMSGCIYRRSNGTRKFLGVPPYRNLSHLCIIERVKPQRSWLIELN